MKDKNYILQLIKKSGQEQLYKLNKKREKYTYFVKNRL